jgi:hypothetical protein
MESVTKRPNHDQCITRDEGKKKQRGADTRQGLWGAPSARKDANGSVPSSPIAAKRKPRANTKEPAADANRRLIRDPSIRTRRTIGFIIARL